MEYKKGSFLQIGAGTFTGRFQAIRILSETTFTDLQDSKSDSAISKYISNNRSSINQQAIIAARDGLFFKSVTISGGNIEIIF